MSTEKECHLGQNCIGGVRFSKCIGRAALQFARSIGFQQVINEEQLTELQHLVAETSDCLTENGAFHQVCEGRPKHASYNMNLVAIRDDPQHGRRGIRLLLDLRHRACNRCLKEFTGEELTSYSEQTGKVVAECVECVDSPLSKQ